MMRRIFGDMLVRFLAELSSSRLASVVERAVGRHIERLPVDDALRFLFRLDGSLYEMQGMKSVEYGGGVHTKHRHMRYHDFFVDGVRSGERVLDIGCGNGALAFDVADKAGATVVGIDSNPDNVAAAKKMHSHERVEYALADANDGLPEGPFDVVVLSNVLEHLRGRPEFLKTVMQAAGPSRFLLRVPLFERDWRVPLKRELGVDWRLDPTHETEYTAESFDGELAAAGLRVTRREVRWGEIWAEAVPGGEGA